MSYFSDEPPTPGDLHEALCAAVQSSDVARIQSLLASGARPLAGRPRNPLALVTTAVPVARLSPDRDEVMDLLLGALDPELDLDQELIQGAFREAFSAGDRPMLEKLLPKLKEGINTQVAGRRILMTALVDLTDDSVGYPGQMNGEERFSWVMEKNPDMSPSPDIKVTQALEFLPFALFRFSSASSNTDEKALYRGAIERLMDAQAPLWFEGAPQSLRAGRDIVGSANPRWLDYLATHFPRQGLGRLLQDIKTPRGQALLTEQIVKVGLEKQEPPSARSAAPPIRF